MRPFLCSLAALALCTGCPPNVQQYASFANATVSPPMIERPVGDVVRLEVRPPVRPGNRWTLEAHGLARFVGPDPSQMEWSVDQGPIVMEAIAAPIVSEADRKNGRRGWLRFALPEGDSLPLDRELPVRPLPYRELAPVTFSSVFSLAPRTERLTSSQNEDRVTVTYRTPIDFGKPYAPRLGAMLLETTGKKVLYAEVKTNFGERGGERVGYDVTFSYPATVAGPVEVVVVEWIGYGAFVGGFDVHRLVVPAAAPEAAAPAETSKAPAR